VARPEEPREGLLEVLPVQARLEPLLEELQVRWVQWREPLQD
jgi:hypothetical protein